MHEHLRTQIDAYAVLMSDFIGRGNPCARAIALGAATDGVPAKTIGTGEQGMFGLR